MAETLPLAQRLAAYRKIVRQNPDLTTQERERMFSMAVWPEDIEVHRTVSWEHFQRCRNNDCAACCDGELAD